MSRLRNLLELYAKDKSDPFLSYGIALEYLGMNNPAEAEKFLKLTIEKAPDYTAAYMQYAQLKANLNQIEEAKKLYLQGIAAALKSGDKRSANEMEEFLDELE